MRCSSGLPNRQIASFLVAAGLLAAAPARVEAAPVFNGLYAALGGGVVGLEDSQLDYAGAVPTAGISYDAGWAVSGAVGTRVLDLYRLELEVSHRENDVYALQGGFAGGTVASTTYMVNGYFDFPVYVRDSGVVPYVGLGLGRAQFAHEIRLDGALLSDSNSHAFAYQAIGGLELPLVPRRVSTTLEYRYLSTTRPLFQDQQGLFYHSDYASHTVMIGVRWAL